MSDLLTSRLKAAMDAAWLATYPPDEADEALPLDECLGDPSADGFREGFMACLRVSGYGGERP